MIGIMAIGGVPSTGKSTLMKAFVNQNIFKSYEIAQAFEFAQVKGYRFLDHKLLILGIYENNEPFSGTDKLSFSVQRSFDHLLQVAQDAPEWNEWVILFEGDRLFNRQTLAQCLLCPHRYYVVTVDEKILAARQQKRSQNEAWVKGRMTKISNLRGEFTLTHLDNTSSYELLRNVRTLYDDLLEVQKEAAAWTSKISSGS